MNIKNYQPKAKKQEKLKNPPKIWERERERERTFFCEGKLCIERGKIMHRTEEIVVNL